MAQAEYHPALHTIALLTACATFPLIFMGGLVTSHHAGMSVPDWPNSYGYNMFLFPPRFWVGGILYEHTHRLMGTVVGFLAVLFALAAWGTGQTLRSRRRLIWIAGAVLVINVIGTAAMSISPASFHIPEASRSIGNIASQGAVTAVGILLCSVIAWFCRQPDQRRWVRWLSIVSLICVCLQGLLGGLRVDLINLALAIVHGCFAQAFFCLATFTAIVTSRWWMNAPDLSRSKNASTASRLIGLAFACLFAVYAQLIVGAMMRHFDAGLAIPDLPLAYGKLLPPTTATELATVNAHRTYEMNLRPVDLTQIWLHFGHRIGACIVTFLILSLVTFIALRHRNNRPLLFPAVSLIALLLTQLTLGVLTVLLRKPADIASAHVATGAAVLVTTFIITVRAMRLYSPAFRSPSQPLPREQSQGFEAKHAIA